MCIFVATSMYMGILLKYWKYFRFAVLVSYVTFWDTISAKCFHKLAGGVIVSQLPILEVHVFPYLD